MPTDHVVGPMKVDDAEIPNGRLTEAQERGGGDWANCCKTVAPEALLVTMRKIRGSFDNFLESCFIE